MCGGGGGGGGREGREVLCLTLSIVDVVAPGKHTAIYIIYNKQKYLAEKILFVIFVLFFQQSCFCII